MRIMNLYSFFISKLYYIIYIILYFLFIFVSLFVTLKN